MEWFFTILAVLLATIIPVAIIIKVCQNKKRKLIDIVLKSNRISKLKELNKEVKFYEDLLPEYCHNERCQTKQKFDKFDFDSVFMDYIESNMNFLKRIIQERLFNYDTYKEYIQKVNNLHVTVTKEYCKKVKIKYKKFVRYESEIFNKNVKKPVIKIYMILVVSYISPQGRNFYKKEKIYDHQKISEMIQNVEQMIAERQTRQYQIRAERAKMTNALRYEIMRRDNFRCQICGSTAKDGVKLHIDHIIPVSKGGLSEKSNLRTLCDRCNLGKNDKLE